MGWRDLVVPAALLALGAVELATLRTPGWQASIGLEAVAAVALVFRRTHAMVAVPIATLVLMVIPLTGTKMEEAATPIFFLVLGVYSLGRFLPLRWSIFAAALTCVMVTADLGLDPADNDFTDAVFVLALALPPYAFGRVTRKLDSQRRLLAAQQEQLRAEAVRDERDRIAREMHDVIGHSISAMVVQTAAAQDLVRRDPARASAILEQVAESGRAALAETGRLLHLIRDESDELGLRPAPGLADLPELVATYQEGGLDVEASLELPEHPLPGGIDVSAYRVVQEALTNAVRHGAGPVRLAVAASPGELRITCSNRVDGVGRPGSGLGLQGMAERVDLLGGSLRHGAFADRFEVDVTIPLAEASA